MHDKAELTLIGTVVYDGLKEGTAKTGKPYAMFKLQCDKNKWTIWCSEKSLREKARELVNTDARLKIVGTINQPSIKKIDFDLPKNKDKPVIYAELSMNASDIVSMTASDNEAVSLYDDVPF